jgi:hypothetical protein
MTRQVALLRGINVGGHNRVAMAQLRLLVLSAPPDPALLQLALASE